MDVGSHAGDVDDDDNNDDDVVGSRVRDVAVTSLLEADRGILAGILFRIN